MGSAVSRADRHSAGRSPICPYIEGEEAGHRHYRRKLTNLDAENAVMEWCEARGIHLAIRNEGHHWEFRLPNGRIVEWWPSSAKLVIDKHWDEGIHVHDHEQARTIVEREAAKAG